MVVAVENALAASCSKVYSKRVVVGEGVALEAGIAEIVAVDAKAPAGSETGAGSKNVQTR